MSFFCVGGRARVEAGAQQKGAESHGEGEQEAQRCRQEEEERGGQGKEDEP